MVPSGLCRIGLLSRCRFAASRFSRSALGMLSHCPPQRGLGGEPSTLKWVWPGSCGPSRRSDAAPGPGSKWRRQPRGPTGTAPHCPWRVRQCVLAVSRNAPAASAESARGIAGRPGSTSHIARCYRLTSCSAAQRCDPCRIDEVLPDHAPSAYGRRSRCSTRGSRLGLGSLGWRRSRSDHNSIATCAGATGCYRSASDV